MIETEIELSGRSRQEIISIMKRNLEIMKSSVVNGLTTGKIY